MAEKKSKKTALPSCADREEVLALNARVLQSDLMVAALTCNQQSKYNEYVEKYKPQLASYSQDMRGYFQRIHAKNSNSQMDRFVTRMANQSFQRYTKGDASSVCSEVTQLMNELIRSSDKLSEAIKDERLSARHGVRHCVSTASIKR